MMHFRLVKDIYAGTWGPNVIILDARKDKYYSLTDNAAELFQAALSTDFSLDNDKYVMAATHDTLKEADFIHNGINHFIEQGFLEVSPKSLTDYDRLNGPLKDGGLADYKWDYKSSLAPFSNTPKSTLLKNLFTLHQVNRALTKKGILGVIDWVREEEKKQHSFITPSAAELTALSDSIDLACAFYPKKIYCLGWASTFVICALRKGWRCSLTIGVQALPFYAHAWAECEGKVINDEAIIQEYLTVLYKEPFFK